MTAVAHVAPSAGRAGRPRVGTLLRDQYVHALQDLWRSRLTLVFSLALPLVWLLVIGAVAGNDVLGGTGGVRVMQVVTPTAAAMGLVFATFPSVATTLAESRDRHVLKRVLGSPLPVSLHVAARIAAAATFALASVTVALAVGVLAYDVQVVPRTLPATLVTLAAGLGCFAALGVAAAALSRTAAAAQAGAVAAAVVLMFASGTFMVGVEMPAWLSSVAAVLPLEPLTTSLQGQFDPRAPGSGWDGRSLLVLATWGAVAVTVASTRFRVEPAAPRAVHHRGRAAPEARAQQRVQRPVRGAPSSVSLLLDQAGAADRAARRDTGTVFFAVVMPVGLHALMVTLQGPDVVADGVPFVSSFAASMAAWGLSVIAFMNLPEAVARARDRGELKRLTGTPLRGWQYLAGRVVAGMWLSLVVALALMVTSFFLGAPLAVPDALLVVPAVVLGTLAMAALGFAVASACPTAEAVGALALVVLLPLAFVSDVFVVPLPDWMAAVGSVLPLHHVRGALLAAWGPGDGAVPWGHLGVLLLWSVVAGAFALRFFRAERR